MNYPHVVNVMRPTETEGSLGQTQGDPVTVCNQWPCKIRSLNGREQEFARTTQFVATFAVEGRGDPSWENRERFYLTGGTLKERKLNVAYVNDADQNGLDLTLFCGE